MIVTDEPRSLVTEDVLLDPRMTPLDRLRLECAVNPTLRSRFLEDPKAVMLERGIHVPADVKIAVTEETLDTHVVALPPFVGGELTDKNLIAITAQRDCRYCTLCTLTSIICAGSLVSLTSARNAAF